eukprot:TRINITY_DN5761_c0_g2_i2.p1 TRINITY_DN5761_c0_g2~~TRINITY_DN5761_c0_g2_i2.p1  ORF type:complete len:394 (+),score=46.90 TRINITY_DN5761_c0_g2_i2:47-1228(+)
MKSTKMKEPQDTLEPTQKRSGERKFTCDLCNKAFIHGGHLNRHKKRVHFKESKKAKKASKMINPSDFLACQLNDDENLSADLEVDMSLIKTEIKEELHSEDEKTTSRIPNSQEIHQTPETEDMNLLLEDYGGLVKIKEEVSEDNEHLHQELSKLKRKKRPKKPPNLPEKIFTCANCSYTSAKRWDMIKHERIHSGVKPFSCKFCKKAFADKSACVKHERIHTGVKPFSCNYCGKSFVQKTHLSNHEVLHTGLKPFSCNVCGRPFARSDKCRLHEKICKGAETHNKGQSRKRTKKVSDRDIESNEVKTSEDDNKDIHEEIINRLYEDTAESDKSINYGDFLQQELKVEMRTEDLADQLKGNRTKVDKTVDIGDDRESETLQRTESIEEMANEDS